MIAPEVHVRFWWVLFLVACTRSQPEETGDDSAEDTDTAPPETLEPSDVVLRVDRTAVLGPSSRLNGVNKSPLVTGRFSGEVYDFTSLYGAFGVSAVRAHDGVLDLCPIYLDDRLVRTSDGTDLDADACRYTPGGPTDAARWSVNDTSAIDLPASYDFSAADAEVDAIVDGHFELLLRLGESYDGPNDTDDPHAWSRVAGRVYERYAVGWPDTTVDTSRAPRWVEIHNEPDGFFWLGTTLDFLTLYQDTWDAVDAVSAPGLVRPSIGGSGFTAGGVEQWLAGHPSFVTSFVDANAASRLDFLSFHHYGQCDEASPAALSETLHRVRSALDAAGGTSVPLLLTEWNIGLGQDCGDALFRSAQAAAYVGASLALQQEPGLKLARSYFYSGVPPMSLFAMDESSHELTVDPTAYAFFLHAGLTGDLLEIALCDPETEACQAPFDASSGGEPVHAVAVGRVDGTVRVVIANYSDQPRSVEVRLDEIGTSPTTWEVVRTSHGGAPVVVPSELDGSGHRVPTAAGLADALEKIQTTTPPALGRAARIELAAWEVVQVGAN